MPGPLEGVKVIDLTTVVLGPFATQILAELGAEVIKVESREGDNMRHPGPMKHPGMGYMFLALNRGKRGIVLDLKHPDGLGAMKRLIAQADVLIYNVRPQAMARLGLSWEDVSAINPRLLYVGTYGYSQKGPYAAKAAYDDLIQGASGLPWVVSQTSDAPNYAPVNFADRVTGLHAVYTVTAALFQRSRSGKGQSIEVPMFESISHFVLGDHLAGLSWMEPVGGAGYQRLLARRPYPTADGYLCVLVYNDKQWRSFLDAIGEPERMRDPRYATQASRAANIHDIYAYLAELFRTRSTEAWITLLEKADIPVSRMNSIDDVVHDAHLNESGFFYTENHPSEGRMRAMRTPTSWGDTPTGTPGPAPRLGEHSAQVLREAGYSDTEIEAMSRSGATFLG